MEEWGFFYEEASNNLLKRNTRNGLLRVFLMTISWQIYVDLSPDSILSHFKNIGFF
jgi:hypothetical protein